VITETAGPNAPTAVTSSILSLDVDGVVRVVAEVLKGDEPVAVVSEAWPKAVSEDEIPAARERFSLVEPDEVDRMNPHT
jgi:hypothetical protein